MYYVYLLRCQDGTIYTGVAKDVAARMKQHAAGTGSKYVRARGLAKVVHTEAYRTRGRALSREYQIKTWRRADKLRLIAGK